MNELEAKLNDKVCCMIVTWVKQELFDNMDTA